MLYFLVFILLLIGLFLILTYNRLVKLQALVQEAWSSTDVLLKKRYDLLPNLVETVKGYATHESETLSKITQYRSKALSAQSQEEQIQTEKELQNAMIHLNAVAENYPELKANQNFLNLQNQLSEIETSIEMGRRYYNGTVRNFNTSIQSFPANLIANSFGFTKAEFFVSENPSAERSVPNVKF